MGKGISYYLAAWRATVSLFLDNVSLVLVLVGARNGSPKPEQEKARYRPYRALGTRIGSLASESGGGPICL